MPVKRLKEFLDQNNVRYVTIAHSPAYTAAQIAHSAHISGKMLAKTVILKADDQLLMAVVPANYKVDTEALREALGARTARLCEEREFASAFPGCEVGAMPPFGNLWDVPVYVAEELAEDEVIAFNAGTHTELIQLSYADFERLVKPEVLSMVYAAP
jgi:Ala-tRNA(Pro) deacylase